MNLGLVPRANPYRNSRREDIWPQEQLGYLGVHA